MQTKQALSRREELVWVAGTVDVAVLNPLGGGESEAALSSGGVRASRPKPCVLQRTGTTPKDRQVGKCKKPLEGMSFLFLCLNYRTQQHCSGLDVHSSCAVAQRGETLQCTSSFHPIPWFSREGHLLTLAEGICSMPWHGCRFGCVEL